MAFLKFLSKKPRKLDIPPPPPVLDIPPPPEDLELPELPPLSEETEEEIELEEVPIKFPPLKPIREDIIPIKPIPTLKPAREFEPPKEEVKKSKVVVKKQKFPSIGREMFVKSDQYREVLDSINAIKRKIRESENILERLNEIKNNKDKEFEKWRTLLEDIERKSVYIDKTLFER